MIPKLFLHAFVRLFDFPYSPGNNNTDAVIQFFLLLIIQLAAKGLRVDSRAVEHEMDHQCQ